MTLSLSEDGRLLFAINQSLLNLVRKDLFLVNVSWNEKQIVVTMIYQTVPNAEAHEISEKVKMNVSQRIPGREVEVYALTGRRDMPKDFGKSRTVFAVYTY